VGQPGIGTARGAIDRAARGGLQWGVRPPPLLKETALLFFLLALLFPLAFYCLVLGTINRRSQPLMVSGCWDFVGLLCALSGFLLIVGPGLIDGLYKREVERIYQRDIENAAKGAPQVGTEEPQASVDNQVQSAGVQWWIIWASYFAVTVGGAAILAWTRRNVAVIYNLDPASLQDVLIRTFERIGLLWQQEEGDRLLLRERVAVAATEPTSEPTWSVCDVNPFPLLYHLTLHWRRDPNRLRPRVEAELSRQLNNVHTYDNPASIWFLSVASCLFGLVLMASVIVILGTFFPLRR
jgi:hypothetical protein